MDIAKKNQNNNGWDPVGELDRIRREIDTMFGLRRPSSFSDGLFDRSVSPAVDVVETEDDYQITADLPGVDQKDVDVTLADNVLTIKGEKREEKKTENSKVYRKENWEGGFQRTLSLPKGVDQKKIEASMENGILTITLPKQEEVKPRKINVNVK
jgi:HSP20 family protein